MMNNAEKLTPKCQCGEPIESGRVLCPHCVDLVNERAMATMKTVIGALGLS